MVTILIHFNLLLTVIVLPCNSYEDFSTYPKNYEEIRKKFKTDRPTIGIASMENNAKELFETVPNTDHTTYVAGSYVKLLSGAGARAVPLLADMPEKELKQVMNSINGVILSGGDAKFENSGYEAISRMVYKYSIEKYKKGEIWPILGICRGSQMLPVITAMKDFLIHTESKNYSVPLEFDDEWKESRLFGNASEGVIQTLRNKPITINAHVQSLPTKFFVTDTKLRKFYRVISTNKDMKGEDFISTFEGRKYPMYGLQWHPEKLLYVWNPVMAADHSLDSIRVAQYIANFFVSEAKQNSNKFPSREVEEKYLIYKWNPTYFGNITDTPYEEIYLFPML